jgi:ComF family protein
LCPRCLATVMRAPARELPGLDGIRVRALFEGAISAAIHAFKYQRQTRLVQPLGALLCEAVQDAGWSVDVVTAVPLHAARLRERGYNQAALLADYLARAEGWACIPSAVQRVRETASQVHLNAQERRANVADAFAADPDWVRGHCVLIIDDVLTTGATLGACADAVRAAGATRVYGATVAGAVYSKDPA